MVLFRLCVVAVLIFVTCSMPKAEGLALDLHFQRSVHSCRMFPISWCLRVHEDVQLQCSSSKALIIIILLSCCISQTFHHILHFTSAHWLQLSLWSMDDSSPGGVSVSYTEVSALVAMTQVRFQPPALGCLAVTHKCCGCSLHHFNRQNQPKYLNLTY